MANRTISVVPKPQSLPSTRYAVAGSVLYTMDPTQMPLGRPSMKEDAKDPKPGDWVMEVRCFPASV